MANSRRRWPRIIAALAAGIVLVTTVIGAGVNHLMGNLQGNIKSLDVSSQLDGSTNSPETAGLVYDADGNTKPLNVLLMGTDTRTGKGNQGYGKKE